jgi:hypothetical protein
VGPSSFSSRTSTLNDARSRPVAAARSAARIPGRSPISRSTAIVHGPCGLARSRQASRRVSSAQPSSAMVSALRSAARVGSREPEVDPVHRPVAVPAEFEAAHHQGEDPSRTAGLKDPSLR